MIRCALAVLILPVALLACGDSGRLATTSEAPTGPVVPPILVVVVSPDGATIPLSDSLQMQAAVTIPRDWGATGFTWRIADSTVAVISSTGMVYARNRGTTLVAATARNSGTGTAMGMATIHVE